MYRYCVKSNTMLTQIQNADTNANSTSLNRLKRKKCTPNLFNVLHCLYIVPDSSPILSTICVIGFKLCCCLYCVWLFACVIKRCYFELKLVQTITMELRSHPNSQCQQLFPMASQLSTVLDLSEILQFQGSIRLRMAKDSEIGQTSKPALATR